VFYFVFFTILGRLFIIGLVISFFQEGFTSTLKEKLLREKQKGRLALISSMILIDLNSTGTVEKDEFHDFVKKVNPGIRKDVCENIFYGFKEKHSTSLGIKEFVLGIEKTSKEKLENEDFCINPVHLQISREMQFRDQINSFLSFLSSFINKSRKLAYPLLASPSFDTFVLVCIIIQIFVLSLYGTLSNQTALDFINSIIVLINLMDVILKITAYGKSVSCLS
jgi:hypothetical protein